MEGFTHQREETVILKPAQVMVIDFNPDKGGIVPLASAGTSPCQVAAPQASAPLPTRAGADYQLSILQDARLAPGRGWLWLAWPR